MGRRVTMRSAPAPLLALLAATGLTLLLGLILSAIADTSRVVIQCESEGPPTADVCGEHLTFSASSLTWALLLALLAWLALAGYLARTTVTGHVGAPSPAERRFAVLVVAFAAAVLGVAVLLVGFG